MAFPTKGTRKITVGGRRYVWIVSEHKGGWSVGVLTVLSPDKKFHAKFELSFVRREDHEEKAYIVIIGPRFAGAETGGVWKRFRCPCFAWGAVTPADVRRLIEWCLDEGLARQEIDLKSHGGIL